MADRLTLMQVHAHPDDEASKGAGTNAKYVAEGVRTVLVCCTGGEAGEILNPKADTPEARADLKAVRMRELDASVAILGYEAVHLLGYRDSGMPDSEFNKHPEAFANADFDEAVGKLVQIVRAERPDVIITYGDEQTAYPHPDHIRCHDISVAAFDAAADGHRYPDAGAAWQPKKLYYVGFTIRSLRAMHDTLLSLGRDVGFYGERLKDAGEGIDHRFMTRIDVTGFIPTRSKALLAHATQIDPDSFWFALNDDERTAAYPHEDYILARTHIDTGVADGEFETDLFAGLR